MGGLDFGTTQAGRAGAGAGARVATETLGRGAAAIHARATVTGAKTATGAKTVAGATSGPVLCGFLHLGEVLLIGLELRLVHDLLQALGVGFPVFLQLLLLLFRQFLTLVAMAVREVRAPSVLGLWLPSVLRAFAGL